MWTGTVTARLLAFIALSGLAGCPGGGDSETETDTDSDTDPLPACTGEGEPDQPLAEQDTCNGDPGIELGDPITDPQAVNNPHHIRFPDARCMTGAGAQGLSGITLQIQPGADRLVIYLQGGGLCVDDLTCAGVRNPDGLPTDPSVLLTRDWILEGGTLFRDPPFDSAHQVFVHYCSGDFHAGNQTTPVSAPGTAVDGRVYTGRANMQAFLGRLVPTFGVGGPHEVDQVVLTGSSAGALGTVMNYDLVQTAFGCTPVHAYVDSAPPLTTGAVPGCYQRDWDAVLNLDPSVPATCSNCDFSNENADNILPHLTRTYPGRRFGWYSASGDCVLRQLLSVPSPSCDPTPPAASHDAFEGHLVDLRASMTEAPNFRMFLHPGDWHTVPIPPVGLGDAIKGPDAISDRRLDQITVGGTDLQGWLTDLVDPGSPWAHACDPDAPRLDELTTCE